MKKKSHLLNMLAVSLGLTLSVTPPMAKASLPVSIEGHEMPSLAPMLEKALPAVVSIQVSGTEPAEMLSPDTPSPDTQRPDAPFPGSQPPLQGPPPGFKFPPQPDAPFSKQDSQPFENLGSGVIIDAEKNYVITNAHVINNADQIKVLISDGRRYTAKLIGKDDQSDIALIQLIDANKLTAIKMADSDTLRVGDFAVAVGNPFGLGQTATSGIISALGRSGLHFEGLENFIQTDASINQGNSGGALLNLNGELIGINTALLSPQGGNIGIGFAIPINMAKNLSNQIIQFGEAKRGLLGIRGSEITPELAQTFKLEGQHGAFVNEVSPNSSAAKAGIKPGDVLVALQDKPLSSFAELRAKVSTAGPGVTMKIGLWRDGKPMDVDVTLDKSPVIELNLEQINPALQGATLSDFSHEGNLGIQVDDVKQGSPAEKIGLKKGDVIISANHEKTENLPVLSQILKTKPDIVVLNIKRKDQSIYLLMP